MCFIAKSNQNDTHAQTQLIDTYLKSVILYSCLSWSYKHTHSGSGDVMEVLEMLSR